MPCMQEQNVWKALTSALINKLMSLSHGGCEKPQSSADEEVKLKLDLL